MSQELVLLKGLTVNRYRVTDIEMKAHIVYANSALEALDAVTNSIVVKLLRKV